MVEEVHLNLSLAIVTDAHVERKKKRKRRVCFNSLDSHEGYEGKIFKLLQMREQMVKLENNKRGAIEDGKGLHLIHLLLMSATAVHDNNTDSAADSLTELYQNVSLIGDSVQRVVSYFADGLTARLLTQKSPFYGMIMKEPTPREEFLAFMDLYRVSPYYQFAHFTANQAIMEAYEEEENNNKSLHVIDFDISYGFQWPSLIQSLSEKATSGRKISLRITGFGRSLEELLETETRLLSFSKGFRNIVFEFQGLLRGSNLDYESRKEKNELVAVNLVLHLNTLNNLAKVSDTLKVVHSLNPSIVILVEQESSRSPRSFLSRFMESLHYFAAMFDSLDDFLPLESTARLSIEKNHLGKSIKRVMNYDKDEGNFPRYEKMETWKGRMESHGFVGIPLSSKCVIQAKLLSKIRSHYRPVQIDGENSCGFRVFEGDGGRALSLGWQDRCLVTASAWRV